MDDLASNRSLNANPNDLAWPKGLKIAIVGRLGAMSRSQAAELVRQQGGQVIDRGFAQANVIVHGAESQTDALKKLEAATTSAIQAGSIEVISETEFWHRLGIDNVSEHESIFYTPRMLSELIEAPIRNVRRWVRLGLLVPTRVNHRLPYFDFEGLQNARRLKQWTDAGLTAESIVRQLQGLLDHVSHSQGYDYEQWDIHLDGQSLLLCDQGRWIEPTGQLRFDLESAAIAENPAEEFTATISISAFKNLSSVDASSIEDNEQLTLLQMAEQAEDDGKLEEAVEWFRVLMSKYGATAELHFSLAELLYRLGDTSAARERYYAALEVDQEFVEARANLGCVLLETGQLELAIAAFEGVLVLNEEFPEVHYHLARALDESGLPDRANQHWRRFTELAPHSPWSVEAHERLESSV